MKKQVFFFRKKFLKNVINRNFVVKTINKAVDMMKNKVLISCTIFVLLFISAWFMNEHTKRDYIKLVLNDTESIADYIFTPEEVDAETIETWNFKSREYIKIRKRMDQTGP
jgi:hypothetical protein